MNYFINFLNGAVIGIANIIPGVSGGTMALVLGIYERLLTAISSIGPGTIKISISILSFKKEKFKEFTDEMKRIDLLFLLIIMLGALTAIVLLAKLMSLFLNDYHDPTYGFFFGLVLLSAYSPYKMIKNKMIYHFVIILIAAVIVLFISQYISSGDKLIEKAMLKGSDLNIDTQINHFYVLFLGGISISAMILPGVSGSFLLLLLGGYFPVLKAIADRDILFLSLFAVGCALGLFIFTKLLNFLLKNFHDGTMSFLVGLVIGSLWMIWPFKKMLLVNSNKVYLNNIFPDSIGMNELLTFLAIILGMFIVFVLLFIEKKIAGK